MTKTRPSVARRPPTRAARRRGRTCPIGEGTLFGILGSGMRRTNGHSAWFDLPSCDGGNKYFCDYKPPAEEMFRVRRDFTKGGGMSAELLSITIRQFKSEDEARAAWAAMTKTLKTCKSEVYEGTKLTYSVMSVPKLGDASTDLKMDADGTTLLQNFVLVGPAMIRVGGGGLMNVDADTMARLLKAQSSAMSMRLRGNRPRRPMAAEGRGPAVTGA